MFLFTFWMGSVCVYYGNHGNNERKKLLLLRKWLHQGKGKLVNQVKRNNSGGDDNGKMTRWNDQPLQMVKRNPNFLPQKINTICVFPIYIVSPFADNMVPDVTITVMHLGLLFHVRTFILFLGDCDDLFLILTIHFSLSIVHDRLVTS